MFGHEFTTHYVLASDYDVLWEECEQQLAQRLSLVEDINTAHAENDAIRAQLSAAEARLVKAREWIGHNGSCMGVLPGELDCDCGLQAFLGLAGEP